MNVLGIESTSRTNSVAVWGEEGLLSEVSSRNYQDLSRRLPGLIDVVLEHANLGGHDALEGLAVSVGPGSFTGIRVGVSYARALAQGLELQLVGVPTLQAAATQAAGKPGQMVVALVPSRSTRVYWQRFQTTERGPLPDEEPGHDDLEELLERLADGPAEVNLCGEGVDRHRDVLVARLQTGWSLSPEGRGAPAASTVARLGRELLLSGAAGDWREVLPLYLTASAAERNLAAKVET